MNEHERINELLPLYVSGALDLEMRGRAEEHLAGCRICREDLALWEGVAMQVGRENRQIVRPPRLERAVLEIARTPRERTPGIGARLRHAWLVVVSQIPLVRREIWPASAAVLLLGLAAALIAHKTLVIYALGPLISAACMSSIYGKEVDPGFELALSTPTSPRQILLARLLLVFGYNLALLSVAGFGVQRLIDAQVAGGLLLAWLAPMTLLSGAALVLSMWAGSLNAITITYVAWLAHLFLRPLEFRPVGGDPPPGLAVLLGAYDRFWQLPGLMFCLALVLFIWAVWLSGRRSAPHLRFV